MTFLYRSLMLLLILLCISATAQVQINPPFAMPDVNIVQDGDRVYAFCGTDLYPFDRQLQTFKMPYWRCFSSTDLLHWRFESMLRPEDTYIGKSDKCFAGHGIQKDDRWYWYFSDYVKSVGVAVSDSPKGPWKDALGKPLLPADISVTKEYDPCAFIDDDGTPYLIYGSWVDRKLCYHIVELNEDMISLKEEPRKIQVKNVPDSGIVPPVDAPFLHKHNGFYYLSWRRPYAVSKNIYGPYEYVKQQDAYGHLGFFTFNNQWFVNYTTLKDGYRRRYRFASIAYVHFKDNGEIADMEPLIHQHGVGQYDANWPYIEAEWYMNLSDGAQKRMKPDSGFQVTEFQHNDYIVFPNIHQCQANTTIELTYSCANGGGHIEIHAYDQNGPLLGSNEFASTGGWQNYDTVTLALQNPPGSLSLAFVIKGHENTELMRLDRFRLLSKDQ